MRSRLTFYEIVKFALLQLCGSFSIGIQVERAGFFSRLLKKHALMAVGVRYEFPLASTYGALIHVVFRSGKEVVQHATS